MVPFFSCAGLLRRSKMLILLRIVFLLLVVSIAQAGVLRDVSKENGEKNGFQLVVQENYKAASEIERSAHSKAMNKTKRSIWDDTYEDEDSDLDSRIKSTSYEDYKQFIKLATRDSTFQAEDIDKTITVPEAVWEDVEFDLKEQLNEDTLQEESSSDDVTGDAILLNQAIILDINTKAGATRDTDENPQSPLNEPRSGGSTNNPDLEKNTEERSEEDQMIEEEKDIKVTTKMPDDDDDKKTLCGDVQSRDCSLHLEKSSQENKEALPTEVQETSLSEEIPFPKHEESVIVSRKGVTEEMKEARNSESDESFVSESEEWSSESEITISPENEKVFTVNSEEILHAHGEVPEDSFDSENEEKQLHELIQKIEEEINLENNEESTLANDPIFPSMSELYPDNSEIFSHENEDQVSPENEPLKGEKGSDSSIPAVEEHPSESEQSFLLEKEQVPETKEPLTSETDANEELQENNVSDGTGDLSLEQEEPESKEVLQPENEDVLPLKDELQEIENEKPEGTEKEEQENKEVLPSEDEEPENKEVHPLDVEEKDLKEIIPLEHEEPESKEVPPPTQYQEIISSESKTELPSDNVLNSDEAFHSESQVIPSQDESSEALKSGEETKTDLPLETEQPLLLDRHETMQICEDDIPSITEYPYFKDHKTEPAPAEEPVPTTYKHDLISEPEYAANYKTEPSPSEKPYYEDNFPSTPDYEDRETEHHASEKPDHSDYDELPFKTQEPLNHKDYEAHTTELPSNKEPNPTVYEEQRPNYTTNIEIQFTTEKSPENTIEWDEHSQTHDSPGKTEVPNKYLPHTPAPGETQIEEHYGDETGGNDPEMQKEDTLKPVQESEMLETESIPETNNFTKTRIRSDSNNESSFERDIEWTTLPVEPEEVTDESRENETIFAETTPSVHNYNSAGVQKQLSSVVLALSIILRVLSPFRLC